MAYSEGPLPPLQASTGPVTACMAQVQPIPHAKYVISREIAYLFSVVGGDQTTGPRQNICRENIYRLKAIALGI